MPSSPFCAVRFVYNNREKRALFASFSARRAEFLCIRDCMAEREGFEPSIQVLARITV
jgi:hypothetical protein